MRHFVFEDYDTGEEFIVGADSEEQARTEAEDYFTEPILVDEFTEEEAEASGLDEY